MTMNYTRCKEMSSTRKRKLGNNTYLAVYPDHYGVRLHSTDVVEFWPDRIVLNSGGWKTVTTKDRINSYSNIRVWSERGVWYCSTNGHEYPFADGISFHENGTVTGAGDADGGGRLRKQIAKYVKGYVAAFIEGQIPAPSGGDCWGCYLVDKNGKPGMGKDHFLEHFRESYYVPSLLNLAARDEASSGLLSTVAKSVIWQTWQEGKLPEETYITARQMKSCLTRYLSLQLGVAP
jgi:hypothetical protein